MVGSASASGGSASRSTQRSRSTRTGRTGQESTSTRTGDRDRNDAANKVDINRSYLVLFLKVLRLPAFEERFRDETYKISDINTWIAEIGHLNTSPRVIRDLHKLSLQKHARATKRTAPVKSTDNANTKTAETKTAETKTAETKTAETKTASNTKVAETKVAQTKRTGGTESQSTQTTGNAQRTVLDVMNTQQVVQIFRAALSIHTYGKRDNRVYEIFKIAFEDLKLSPKYIVGTKYVPSILSSYKKKDAITMKTPTVLEVLLFFHGCSVHNASSCRHVAMAGNRVGYIIHLLMAAWTRLFSLFQNQTVGRIRDAFTPYIVFNQRDCRFSVLNSHANGFSNAQMTQSLLRSNASHNIAHVSADAYNRDVHMDAAMRLIVSLFFKHLDIILRQPYLYSASDNEILRWKELVKFRLPANPDKLPEAFKEIPENVCDTLGLNKDCEEVESEEEGAGQVQVDVDTLEITAKKRKRDEDNGGAQDGTEDTDAVIKTEPKEEPDLIDSLQNVGFRPLRRQQMSENTSQQYEILNNLFKTFFNYYDVQLNDLVAECQTYGISLEEQVDLLLTDPPYNVRREANKGNSRYDVFYESDIMDLCDLCKHVLKPGAHGLIFCSFQQFELYREHLNRYKVTVVDRDTDRTGNTTCEKNLFVVEPTPIVLIKKDGLAGLPVRGGASHINMTEICIHFWKRGPTKESDSRVVDFTSTPTFASKFHSRTNVITDVPTPQADEIRWIQEEQLSATRDESGKSSKRTRRYRLRPEQKSVELLKFLINKFTKPGDLVLDPCGGTFSTLHACMALDNHRTFLGGDRDSECTVAVEDDLLRVFASQLLNPRSDLTTSNVGYTKAAQTVRNHDIQTKINERFDAWSIPPGLVPMQSFPDHIIQPICQYHNDFSLYSTYKRRDGSFTPAQKWNNLWTHRFNNLDPKMLLAAECSGLHDRIKPSTIQHPHVGLGVFATKSFAKGTVVGYYYGSLVYGDLAHNHRVRRRYGTGIMSVSSEDYSKWALQIDFDFIDSRNQKHIGYICPGEFNAMRYINDARYTDGDREKQKFEDGSLQHPRAVNVEYILNQRFNHPIQFESYTAIGVVAVQDILAGQELFLNYGTKYTFPKSTNPATAEDNGDNDPKTIGSTKDQTNELSTKDTKQVATETKATDPATKTAAETKAM